MRMKHWEVAIETSSFDVPSVLDATNRCLYLLGGRFVSTNFRVESITQVAIPAYDMAGPYLLTTVVASKEVEREL